MFRSVIRLSAAALLLSAGWLGTASAATLSITFTNNQAADGVYITPLLTILHDGTFDTFDRGGRTSAELEALAEEGDVSGVRGLYNARCRSGKRPFLLLPRHGHSVERHLHRQRPQHGL